ncbi:UxaA family hydrolase [Sporosarcina sp. ACRSM]|uniref:UxaA family hydrolase n=1 Tax=Sporosarcina sp. ACRSM TaxID=2918216 RepID=UPI001EF3EEBD|nr:UxaA family hydrolase [Sporosarcina sp. ACRSM]MCG7333723.1 UxaA family hydrolase [Sporosarcina sp. ACRSM]
MNVIQIEERDNIGVATQTLKKGDVLKHKNGEFTVLETIPIGHKVALELIPKNEFIIKYNVPIGRAKVDIQLGDYVHTHNVEDVTEELCNKNKELFLVKGGK